MEIQVPKGKTFGIELENYVSDWRLDHPGVYEVDSPVFVSFKGVVKYAKQKILQNKDGGLILHSFPPDKCASCSAHIHIAPFDYEYYKSLYSWISAFQILFKNSPKIIKSDLELSKRHKKTYWAKLKRMSPQEFNSG
ncbi:MAG: hypothetical protein ACTSQ8_23675, partial [Candidatus Helarchaeota archaeon]